MLLTDLKTFKNYGSTNIDAAAPKPSENVINGTSETANDEPERQKWGSPVEFLLSCIAMSVSAIVNICQI